MPVFITLASISYVYAIYIYLYIHLHLYFENVSQHHVTVRKDSQKRLVK